MSESYKFNDEMTCHDMAVLIIDALVDAGFLDKSCFDKATEVAEEELYIRMLLSNKCKK